ncbi:hypothetical protein HZC07_05175 [Candidatus Micrarchaeota archaeon]|nr:hypothetical protein [Candidatus Micrarchaeota archaeon]
MEEIIRTSITLEYAKDWGIERILLDGLQNHNPADSKGTKVEIEIRIDGQWVPLEEAKVRILEGKKVEGISFSDDGRGYDYRKLGLLYSDKPKTKANSRGPVGKFGEGLKMLCAVCVREEIPMRIQSRDWSGIPRAERVEIDGEIAHQLIFDIQTGLEPRIGSRDEFYSPPQQLIDDVVAVGKSVLSFRQELVVLHADDKGNRIIEGTGDIFVKGYLISRNYRGRLGFDYDLNIDDLPRDRDHVKEEVLGNAIGEVIANLNANDRALVGRLLDAAFEKGAKERLDLEYAGTVWIAYENGAKTGVGRTIAHPDIWHHMFEQKFGETAVLESDNVDSNRLARLAGHKVVHCKSWGMENLLHSCGVKNANAVSKENQFLAEEVEGAEAAKLAVHETSWTTRSRAGKWGAIRIGLDATSNHLPKDSKRKPMIKMNQSDSLVKE